MAQTTQKYYGYSGAVLHQTVMVHPHNKSETLLMAASENMERL